MKSQDQFFGVKVTKAGFIVDELVPGKTFFSFDNKLV
jgi:hypothetical protein